MPFLHRELAWLEFDERVLAEAEDDSVPLLERLKFLAIFSANLDEFFMVRVAGLWRQIDAGVESRGPAGLSPREALHAVSDRVHTLVARQHRVFARTLLPALRPHGVRVLRPSRLDARQRRFASEYFRRDILPVLTPMAIDPGHPFPYLANKAICLIAELDAIEESELPQADLCVIHVPASASKRFIALPSAPGRHDFLLLEDLIRSHLDQVFASYRVRSATAIRVTRDSELDVLDDPSDDLLAHIEAAVRNRRMGAAVRLQYEATLPPRLLDMLRHELELEPADLYPSAGPTALTDVMQFQSEIDLPGLRYPTHHPRPVAAFDASDTFAAIRAGDILVHHPYEDFDVVTRFIDTAADDPDVLAIKMTLYRVSANSLIAQALARAASSGKQVAVLVELRARFSEEANIAWARRLEATGAHVVYGIVGLKTHCKAALVVRREADGIRRYVHLGTGNYNHQTARTYTDLGFFTCAEPFGEDFTHLFNLITGYVKPPTMKKVVLAPSDLRNWLVARIRGEAEHARAGRRSGIVAKFNSLSDPDMVSELYAASQAGVPIRLIIRGICCLRPGIPGWSESIRCERIVHRFLEHARILRFESGGMPEIWLSSADWMARNLGGRIEVTWPVEDPALVARIEGILDNPMNASE